MRPLTALLFIVFLAGQLTAAPTGPTLHFDYGVGKPLANPLVKFMYFVPLISPELISISTNGGNTQTARILSFNCRTNGKSFHVICEFEFAGEGMEQNIFDHAPGIQRHDKELKAGKTLAHQITAISVEGPGAGAIEIEGTTTNGTRTVNEMRMRFNSHGRASPVNIDLQDISWHKGAIRYDNETVARVNTLTFRRNSTEPKMEVTLDSVKRKNAGNGLWQNFVGGFKGMTANMFLPPIKVTAEGNQAMMDFGEALATQQPAFTFPFATRLTSHPAP